MTLKPTNCHRFDVCENENYEKVFARHQMNMETGELCEKSYWEALHLYRVVKCERNLVPRIDHLEAASWDFLDEKFVLAENALGACSQAYDLPFQSYHTKGDSDCTMFSPDGSIRIHAIRKPLIVRGWSTREM